MRFSSFLLTKGCCFTAGALLLLSPLEAQESLPERPVLQAARTAVPPVLDGEVAGDPAWAGAVPATGFVQTTPAEGEPASEATEVFVTFDDVAFYVGVICHDRQPEGIVISDSRRDTSLVETDSFQFILSTYGDLQSAFLFGTNPAGLQYDGQVTRDGAVYVGTAGGFNLNWDGVWEVVAKVSDAGWSAEFAIPFRTLRFPAGSPQTWGLNFQRNIRRHKETAFWAPLPRQFGLDRVSLAGRLEGVNVPRQQFLQVTPYVLAESVKGRGGSPETDEDFDAGGDVKFGITPSLALDLTVNTDFAQVEADVQQINLDRFNLFFPEKRPFFLENAGTFQVGIPSQVELFFSRRIGIGPDGETIPIDGGARLSGKAGRTNLGLLYMKTDDAEALSGNRIPENEFAVVRVSQDLGANSSLGVLVTSREATGSFAEDDDEGQTFAIDGRWGVNPNLEIKSYAAKTDTPGIEEDDHSYYLGGRWNSKKVVAELSYAEVGEGFNPEVGFLLRKGYRRPEGFILTRHRPKNRFGLHELRPHAFYQIFKDFDGFTETEVFHAGVHWEFKNGYEIHTGFNVIEEGVKEPFEIQPGVTVPVGRYSRTEAQIEAFTNLGAPVSLHLFALIGPFFDGDRVSVRPTLRFRRTERFTGDLAWRHDNVNLPFGDFETNLAVLRLAYSFTPKLFVESLFQYNTSSDRWSSNVRFGWRESANTGLFVVYNDVQEIGTGPFVEQRQVIVKYSRLFDLWGK